MMWIDPSMVQVMSRKIRNKSKCELEIDLNPYCNAFFEERDGDATESETKEEENDDIIHW